MQNHVFETAKCVSMKNGKKYLVELVSDDCPLNPREHNTNHAKFNFKHKCYSFPYELDVAPESYYRIPVYMVGHGVTRFTISKPSDKWDSCLIGYAYVSPEHAESIEGAELIVNYELFEYEKYVNGEAYGIMMSQFNEWGEKDVVESMWNITGFETALEEMSMFIRDYQLFQMNGKNMN